MDLDLTGRMVVREAMSSPVITVNEDQSVVEAAEVMYKQRIGAVVVFDSAQNPVGILTERDLVYRVISENMVPDSGKVTDVMSKPLRMVDSEVNLEEAMRIMVNFNIRRLGVTYKDKLEGIITDKDILRLMPTLIEIVRERSRIQSSRNPSGPSLVGYCTRCESYSNNLRNVDGELLCEDCRVEDEII